MLSVRRFAALRMRFPHAPRTFLLVAAVVALAGWAGCWPKDDLSGAYAGGGTGGANSAGAAGGGAAGASGSGGAGGAADAGGSAGAAAGAAGSGGSAEPDAAAPPGEPLDASTPDASDAAP